MKKPCVLMILDGWGYSDNKDYNAIYTAKTPNLDSVVSEYPNSFLKCSGLDVGLPKGLMGNSEVGHLN
ncbi:MAG TPA: 2,3-bisphosphoglycerate-independent phosphoglycerate mutase, partial [bacterium]|nr:2,3-bisphosphoglycerate-independent phosphoglycerate mutase [bacterium]